MSAESQRVRQHIIDVFLDRRAHRIVQIALRIHIFGSHGLVDESVHNTLHAYHELYAAGRAEKMSDHGFCRIDVDVLRRIAERIFDRSRLKEVIVVRARAVCVDIIDLLRLYACILHRQLHRHACALAARK